MKQITNLFSDYPKSEQTNLTSHLQFGPLLRSTLLSHRVTAVCIDMHAREMFPQAGARAGAGGGNYQRCQES